jgi:hypothetical protein
LEDTLVIPSTAAIKTVLTASATTNVPIAILRNAPASGAIAELDHLVAGSILGLLAGAAITTGGRLMVEAATARGITATATNFAFGYTLTTGVDGSVMMCMPMPMDIQV